MQEIEQRLAGPQGADILARRRSGPQGEGHGALGVDLDERIRRCKGQTQEASSHRHADSMHGGA